MTLLCPQQWAKQRELEFGWEDGAKFVTQGNFSKFEWNNGANVITIPMDNVSNLPILNTVPGYQRSAKLIANPATISDDEYSDDEDEADDSTIATSNQSSEQFPFKIHTRKPVVVEDPILPEDQAEFLLLHERLGHTSFHKLQKLSEVGRIPTKFKNCRIPVCASCQHGKQHRRPWRTKGSTPSPIGGRTISAPGDCVSIDQLKSSTPGLIGQVKGWLTRERQHVATVFVDHYSDLTFVHVTPSDTSEETVEAKEAFERFAAAHNVIVKHYHADNGRFADTLFKEHVVEKGQTITYCGVGAHHQNGKVEKRIRDIVEQARTMLLHAAHRWPKAVSANLWPFALHHAVRLRNNLESEGASPIARFSGSHVVDNVFWKHQHTFGSPVFVLEAPLQGSLGGKKKWEDRSRVGVFLGHSSQHSQSVALVLNPRTGHVSPQFHVVFDDKFDTVKQGTNIDSLWQSKTNIEDALSDEWNVEIPHPKLKSPWFEDIKDPEATKGKPEEVPTRQTETRPPTVAGQTAPVPGPVPEEATPNDPSPETQEAETPQDLNSAPHGTDHSRKSKKKLRRSGRLKGSQEPTQNHPRRSARLQNKQPHPVLLRAHMVRAGVAIDLEDGTLNELHPLVHVFAATKGDPDTFHLNDALKQPDWPNFKEAMGKEVGDFNERKHWSLVPATILDELKAKGIKFDVIQAVWSFKRKRTPSGQLIKHKSRLCAHGGQQSSNTYWESFSPVVQWTTLRTILTLSIVKGWKARSIDFVLAYPQADLKANIFMRIPYGFTVDKPGKWLLRLEKNIYGLKDAGRTWHHHLKQGLMDRGFIPSKVDPCVFYKGNLILVVYVDDVICFSPDDKSIDEFVQSMQRPEPQAYFLEDQGPLKDYLGIEIVEQDGKVHITQRHLIDKVIATAKFKQEQLNTVETPASSILFKCATMPDIPPNEAPFDYRSLIGQLNYLAATTRPDISFAVHQCARFCANPKKVHYTAAKRIVRYLAGTADKGMILDRQAPEIECYADADFAGAWDRTDTEDPTNVKSRTGFIIKFANCPIYWGSKQQELVALSTVEAEYISLSYATRHVLFILHLLEEMKENQIDFDLPQTKVFAKCFEDNTGCLDLAVTPKLRPRTKHIAIKYHHFLSYVKNDENPEGILHLQWTPSEKQQADVFTKPLQPKAFTALRQLICGW